jgi:hypothetical protein
LPTRLKTTLIEFADSGVLGYQVTLVELEVVVAVLNQLIPILAGAHVQHMRFAMDTTVCLEGVRASDELLGDW